jgi:hypothetical protein
MFAGPNDYSDYFSSAGHWLYNTNITPTYKYKIYLNLFDEIVDYEKQYTNSNALSVSGDSTHVDHVDFPFNNSHNLYTTQTPGFAILNHSSPIKFSLKNYDVWTYMLTSDLTNSINENKTHSIRVYPNPTNETLRINYSRTLDHLFYSIYSINGKLVQEGILKNNEIQIKHLLSGIYLLSINHTLNTKFVVK